MARPPYAADNSGGHQKCREKGKPFPAAHRRGEHANAAGSRPWGSGAHSLRDCILGAWAHHRALALQALQVGAQVRRVLVAQVAIFLQRLVDDPFELRRDICIEAHRSRRSTIQDGVENSRRRCAGKRPHAGGHLVQHDSEAEDVCTSIEFFTQRLLGRHVHHRPQRRAWAGQMAVAEGRGGPRLRAARLALSDFGKTEVQHLGLPAPGHEDVRWLDIAMDDARAVRHVERVGELNGHIQQLLQRERPNGNKILECRAVEMLHHDENAVRVLRRCRGWCRCRDDSAPTRLRLRAGSVRAPRDPEPIPRGGISRRRSGAGGCLRPCRPHPCRRRPASPPPGNAGLFGRIILGRPYSRWWSARLMMPFRISPLLAGECIKKQAQQDRVRGTHTPTRCRLVKRCSPEGVNR